MPDQPSPSAASPPSKPVRSGLLGPVPLLVILTLGAWLLAVLRPEVMTKMGIQYPDKWFMDSYAVLASGDALRAGISPDAPNPLDLMQRTHKYSDWWFVLEKIGLTREDNFALGGSWVAAFLICAIWVLRVRNYREALVAFVFLASPAFLLAVNRANNDLVVFALLALAGICLKTDGSWRLAAAGALVALATGLKFYPAVACLFILLVRPGRRLLLSGGLLAVGLGLVVWNIWPTIGRGNFPIPLDMHKTGLPILLVDLGLAGRIPQLVSAGLIALAGFFLARKGCTTGLASGETGFGERACFVLAAAVLLGCFVAGMSHAYRWIFALMLLPWLHRAAAQINGVTAARWAIRLAFALLLVVVWADGLLCLLLNLFWVPQPSTAVDHAEHVWRLATQPLHWLLACLLAGWLWDLVLEAWRAVRLNLVARPA